MIRCILSNELQSDSIAFFGLSRRNLDLLEQKQPIVFDGQPFGVKGRVMIYFGETETAILEELRNQWKLDVPQQSDEMVSVQRDLTQRQEEIQGEYPRGKLNENDEGALAMAVGMEAGTVKVSFPKPVRWLAFTPAEAREFAALIIRHADAQ